MPPDYDILADVRRIADKTPEDHDPQFATDEQGRAVGCPGCGYGTCLKCGARIGRTADGVWACAPWPEDQAHRSLESITDPDYVRP